MIRKLLISTLLSTTMLLYVFPIQIYATNEQLITHEISDERDLSVLSEELDQFKNNNPTSTEEEQEQHLREFINNGGLSRSVVRRSFGDYLPHYNKLNSKERSLAKSHPLQAVQVYNASQTAVSKTILVYGKNGFQDNSDAFRHCIWNALMKKSIGTTAAKNWATAHEYNTKGIDKEMDLFNNSVGRSINVSYKSHDEIVKSVKNKVKNGNCRRIVKGKLVKTNGTGMK